MISPALHSDSHSTRRFVGHYVEMTLVMFLGMFVLMAPTGLVLGAIGTSWSRLSPAMNVFTMALTMTAPMIAWMRYRGHAWRANLEMAASMLIPTFVVMTLLWASVSTTGALMVPEHAAMLTCMLVAMLLRRNEYDCATHRSVRPAMAT
jgi:O-antigen ligase